MFIELSRGLFDTERIVSVSNDLEIGPGTHREFGFAYFTKIETLHYPCTQDDYAKLKSVLVPPGCRTCGPNKDGYIWVQPKGAG